MDKKSESRALDISTETEEIAVIDQELEKLRIYIKSGLLPASIKTPEQALVITQMGKELGLRPISALTSIYAPNGTPSLMVSLIQSRLEQHGVWWQTLKDYEDQELKIAGGKVFLNKVTIIEFYRKAPDNTILKETGYFDRKTATEVTINAKGQKMIDKDNWSNYERDMIWKNAFRRGARKIANFAFLGFDETESEKSEEPSVLPKPDFNETDKERKKTDVSESSEK